MDLPSGVKMTPMMKQYTEWKDKYPDCLLMFRMGDFFEMFFDDAMTASRLLDITLTARDQEKSIPMAGVPHHALDSYLGRLVRAGMRVAICDQMTEPDGRTIVDRRVVRVVTPGTYTPQDEGSDGRLAAMCTDGETVSLALLAAGTGALSAATLPPSDAASVLSSFGPKEILIPRGETDRVRAVFGEAMPPALSQAAMIERDRSEFPASSGAQWLCRRWGIATLRAMGVEDGDSCAGAAAAALRYLEETQFASGTHVLGLSPIQRSGVLMLDQTTQTNLELVDGDASLADAIDSCRTPQGRRLLREWILAPSADVDEITERQDRVEALFSDAALMRSLSQALDCCRDIERAIGRIALRTATPRDLGAVRDTLASIPKIKKIVEESGSGALARLFAGAPDVGELSDELARALSDELPRLLSAGGVIRSGYDAELDDARDAIENAQEHLREFEQSERERTGIKLKVGINKVFGYYIEVGKSAADSVPDDYIRRQTVANGERFVNERLKDIERRAYRAEAEIVEREEELYADLCALVMESAASCQAVGRAIAAADVMLSFAAAARDGRYVRPVVDESRVFDVKGARHPVVERALGSAAFTPNDICLDPDSSGGRGSVAIITGPNMAGKSTYLRTAALIAIMAHMGSFVPAESARIGRIDRIFTRIGARDELAKGRSTFMVEMVETAGILRSATGRSLIVLDEIGRGTSTYDGMSIAWAVVEFLNYHIEGHTKALFATHYHELTELDLPMTRDLSMAVDESADGIRFLHKIVEGPADRSYGVEVAKLAGVPSLVIKRAEEILSRLEEDGSSSGRRSKISETYAQKEIFFDVEREGIIEQLAACDPDQMTPIAALEMLAKLREKSRKVLGR